MGSPIFSCTNTVWRGQHREIWKHSWMKWVRPFFLDSVVLRECPKVKWRIPFFGVHTPRGKASARKIKTPEGQWTLGPGRALSTSGCHQIGTFVPKRLFKDCVHSQNAGLTLANFCPEWDFFYQFGRRSKDWCTTVYFKLGVFGHEARSLRWLWVCDPSRMNYMRFHWGPGLLVYDWMNPHLHLMIRSLMIQKMRNFPHAMPWIVVMIEHRIVEGGWAP